MKSNGIRTKSVFQRGDRVTQPDTRERKETVWRQRPGFVSEVYQKDEKEVTKISCINSDVELK